MWKLQIVMALFILGGVACAPAASAQTTDAHKPFPLWPDGAPGALGREPVDVPTLAPYLPPKGKAAGAAVIVCPGGGYTHLADHEGAPVAEWLNTIGVTAFVLKYRLGPRYHHPAPLQDSARAIRTVRARAAEWGIDPKRIGILGFSAGGHVASTIGTHFDAGKADANDPIERVSSRPDLLMLIYPVITMGDKGHPGSRQNLLGKHPDAKLVELYSNEKQVTANTPPAFLAHARDDKPVPPENSRMFYEALRAHKVPCRYLERPSGGHGLNGYKGPMWDAWQEQSLAWLAEQKMIPKEK